MNWKNFLSIRHNHINRHHRYQMSVVFWFILYFILFFVFFVQTDKYNLDINIYQWYYFIPLMFLYVIYNLGLRNKITKKERISPVRRPIMHWVALGISSLVLYTKSPNLETRPESVIIAFIIFSLFIADGYWDFKNNDLRLSNLFRKK